MKSKKKESVTTLFTKEQIDDRLCRLVEEILADFRGETLTVVCMLKGAVMLFADLVKKLNIPVKMDFIVASSYGSTQNTSGTVKISKDLGNPITGEHVLLVEDIIDTGLTLSHVVQHLYLQKPESLKVCVLLDKPSRRLVDDIEPDYVGFEIEDKFIVGYGLDYDQRYRNLPYIGIIEITEE